MQSLLYDSLEKRGAQVSSFSTRDLFFNSWDVWHLHWPVESIVVRRRGVRFLRLMLFWLELKVARLKKTRIFWTVHNLRPHERNHPLLEQIIWRIFLPNVDGIICMSELGQRQLFRQHPRSRSIPTFTIPHGHYRGAYPDVLSRDQARGALGIPRHEFVIVFIGQIRAYKGVVQLIRCFSDARLANSRLLVAGVANDAMARKMKKAAGVNANVKLVFEFVERNDVQKYLKAADLVVLPYTEVLNSGSAILALSFDRPILVPSQGALAELRNVVGPKWVSLYEGELSPTIIRAAVQWTKARQIQPDARAPLDALSWEGIARQTIQAFSCCFERPMPHARPYEN